MSRWGGNSVRPQRERRAGRLISTWNLLLPVTLPGAACFQINAVSLYLLYLVEMISSGLQIIYNTDEVRAPPAL